MTKIAPTERTTLKRLPRRGEFMRAAIYRILDEGMVCHVGFVIDGKPFIIPTGYARCGDEIYLHGSRASRMLQALANGAETCITVTLLDGLVLARSAFHHSMNYRSVVIFGKAREVTDPAEQMSAMEAFTEHIVPGRWREVRIPNQQEMKATMILAIPINEASAKVRTGPPIDDAEDMSMPVWAGVLPLTMVTGTAQADEQCLNADELPEYLRDYRRPVTAEG